MPIKPEHRALYPKRWKAIRAEILERAGHCCEGSPDFPECRAPNYSAHPDTGSKVVLTIGHLNHNPKDSRRKNLRAWCQRCHLNYDKEHHRQNTARTHRAKHPVRDMLDAMT